MYIRVEYDFNFVETISTHITNKAYAMIVDMIFIVKTSDTNFEILSLSSLNLAPSLTAYVEIPKPASNVT